MMVHRYRCEECDTRVDTLHHDGTLYCECGEELDYGGMAGCVRDLTEGETPNGDLEELVEDWREEKESYNQELGAMYESHATQLEEAIVDGE